jgi:hypothetical protein
MKAQPSKSWPVDQPGQLLRAALGFAGCSIPSYDRAPSAPSARGSTPGPASGTSPSACTARADLQLALLGLRSGTVDFQAR